MKVLGVSTCLYVAAGALVSEVSAHESMTDAASQSASVLIVGVENYFGEHCIALAANQRLQYQYTSKYPLDFNVHQHPDNNSIVFLRKEAAHAQLDGQLLADKADHYCFTWTNTADRNAEEWQVTLRYQITQ